MRLLPALLLTGGEEGAQAEGAVRGVEERRQRAVAETGLAVVLHEEAELPLSGLAPPPGGDIMLVVGPEGGVTEEELDRFREAGAVAAVLGPTILRTSTAGVAAASVLLARCGRW